MSRAKEITSVILGADVNGLGHVRSLGIKGIYSYVIFAAYDFQNIARFSKYCTPIFLSRNGVDYETELIKILLDLSKPKSEKRVLFATSDFFVNLITANRKLLQRHYLFNLPSENVLQLIINKYETDKIARSADVCSPKTLLISTVEKIDEICDDTFFPCIIKPLDSFSISFPGKNKVANTRGELLDLIEKYPELLGNIIAQEIIPGGEENIFQCNVYIGRNLGVQFFTMQKIHQRPPGYGVATLGRSITIPDLMQQSQNLLKHIEYTGFASLEFKKSDHNSQYYLIEINPRLPWYNLLMLSSGINFPYLAYCDLTGKTPPASLLKKQKDNVYWMHFRHEISGLRQRKALGMSYEMVKTLKTLAKVRSFAYFDFRDLKPFFMSLVEFLSSVKRKLFSF
jgi:predicted ATP-grasp superfamily ATP-dependent carboligase